MPGVVLPGSEGPVRGSPQTPNFGSEDPSALPKPRQAGRLSRRKTDHRMLGIRYRPDERRS